MGLNKLVAMNKALYPLGHQVDNGLQKLLIGHSDRDAWLLLFDHFGFSADLEECVRLEQAALLDILASSCEPLPGVCSGLAELKVKRITIGLATSGSGLIVNAMLSSLGLADYFQAVAYAELVTHAKPAPDLYLKAAELIGMPPEHCIAVEDSPPGIASAKAAGMFTVQVRASSFAYGPQPEADVVIETLEDFPFCLLDGER